MEKWKSSPTEHWIVLPIRITGNSQNIRKLTIAWSKLAATRYLAPEKNLIHPQGYIEVEFCQENDYLAGSVRLPPDVGGAITCNSQRRTLVEGGVFFTLLLKSKVK